MEPNMVCISGDKGDAAQLLGLPMILFDDREDNLVDVVNKGSKHNVGVVVRRGDAQFKRVHRRNQHLVINNPLVGSTISTTFIFGRATVPTLRS